MNDDFRAGADWFVGLSHLFTIGELRLIWAMKRVEGEFLSEAELQMAMTGRRFGASNSVSVMVGRIRDRALGMGFEIETERGKGRRIVVTGKGK
jgi:DNA-binding response OmpR family regulator